MISNRTYKRTSLYLIPHATLLVSRLEMMIAMMIMLLCVRVSVLMTTNASHHIQAFHELGYDQKALSLGFSRKLMVNKMGERYEDQDLVFYNDKKKATYVGETWKRGEDVMLLEAQGSDPTQFTSMDYSHMRTRRPIHNSSSTKSDKSP